MKTKNIFKYLIITLCSFLLALSPFKCINVSADETDDAVDVSLPDTVLSSWTTSHTLSDISISWSPIDTAEGYEITFIHGDSVSKFETADYNYTFTNLTPATIYTYTLRYFYTLNGIKTYSDYSEDFFATTSVQKISNLRQTGYHSDTNQTTGIFLTWDMMNDATYNIYFKKSSDTSYQLASEVKTNTYYLNNLDPSEKYDIYVQAYCLALDNMGEASEILSLYTCPSLVSNLKVIKEENHDIQISWDANSSGDLYYIYRSINDSPYEFYKSTTETTLSETGLTAGTVYSYEIAVHNSSTNLDSTVSEPLRTVTIPYVTTGLALSDNTASSIKLSWDYNQTATGYIIYRRKGSGDFEYLTSTTDTTYTDNSVLSGTNYRYKIMTYADTEAHTSDFGEVQKTSTLPAKVKLSGKAGTGKLRLSWPAVTGAHGYYIYQNIDGNYTLIDTLEGNKSTSKEYYNLTIGQEYLYKVCAYRTAFNTMFTGEDSDETIVTPENIKATTMTPSYYKTKKKLINSPAWKNVPLVKKYANYSKSYTIPGIRHTNINGFKSTNMCPQGLTFAKDYLLISAYDLSGEENSVIYVLDKAMHDLMTVVVLPDKSHVGGITFDGKKVWLTHGKKLATLDFKQIVEAADQLLTYVCLDYTGMYTTPYTVSFLTYYKNLLWTGNFSSSSKGTLRSYRIEQTANDTDTLTATAGAATSAAITLTQQSSTKIPAAVQGIAFSGNKLILSRAYGYTNELNVYKVSGIGTSSMKIGSPVRTVKTPALNEEIAISGNYIYINFESAIPNSKALNHMDRVLAIKLKGVLG